MISRYFIHHPIFASVLSLVIVFAGLVAIKNLSIEQFPNITPPLIQLTTQYYGASADTIANDVASPLEQQIMGTEDMIYLYSQNSSSGNITLDVYFAIGADADLAQVNVQNRVEQTLSQLPEAVQKQGISIRKQTPNILLVIALQSPDGRYDQTFLSNFASINIVNDLYLLAGISNISIIGQRDYAIRIWLKPDLMAQMGISPSEVVSAVQEQNADFGLGQLGQEPNVHVLPMTVPLSTQGRLSTPEQFANIVVRADNQGSMVLLKDIATVTLGAKDYSVDGEVDGKPALLMAVYQDYGANALQVSEEIHQKMKELSQYFPEGVQYSIPYDSTIFIHQSIAEVFRTMLEATLLVMFVMFLFLQKWRAALIPVMALIVSIVGTFAGMYAIGYSINTLTLFGMVLAIGIVVDDAIVVVENIERNMHELNLSPKEAALKAMEEVTAPIIAIVCVLSAVFIPVAFLGGIAGQLYRQFAITIAISVTISGFVALTLSPAVSAILLKPQKPYRWAEKFNSGFEKIRNIYLQWTRKLVTHISWGLFFFAALLAAIVFLFFKTPTAFIPDEDQGYLIAIATLPDGASLERTAEIDRQIEEIARKHEGVDYVVSFTGFSLIESLNRTTIGTSFIVLKDWSERKKKNLHASAILKDLNQAYFNLQDAATHVFNPPAIQGLGTVGGFEFWLENRSDDKETLKNALFDFIKKAKDVPALSPLQTTAQFNNLQFYVDIDRPKAKMLGVSISEILQALETLIGSMYVNNFNKFGRVYQVIVQAEPAARERLSNLGDLYVRSMLGQMVPLNAMVTVEPLTGPNLVSRFNDSPAAEILGGPAPGFSSGQALKAMQELAKKLPSEVRFGWSGAAYQEIATGGTSLAVLGAALIMIFLVLAALYENWLAPIAILMAVPFAIFGAFVAVTMRGLPNDIYFQIGLVTLIALAAKNSILIVEFAIMKSKEGMSLEEASIEAAKLRFRAILMTSLAFIFGVVPLVLSSGAGAASRHSVGTGVMGGMLFASTLALLFVPMFFKLLYRQKK